jgi:hypothetical protein
VKLDSFLDVNPFEESSAGVKFFATLCPPEGQVCLWSAPLRHLGRNATSDVALTRDGPACTVAAAQLQYLPYYDTRPFTQTVRHKDARCSARSAVTVYCEQSHSGKEAADVDAGISSHSSTSSWSRTTQRTLCTTRSDRHA